MAQNRRLPKHRRAQPEAVSPYRGAQPHPAMVAATAGAPSSASRFSTLVIKHWPLWSLGLLTVVGGVGLLSALALFRIPNLPNCRAIFWPLASATTRLQCAEAYAGQDSVEGYLDAISLVSHLPEDHPLRADINQRIEVWAEQVLDLAEDTFQAGELTEAINIAQRIPTQTAAARLVNERVGRWKGIWQEAEAIYSAAEQALQNRNFKDAFSKAIQLLEVGNRYWEVTRYEELTELISSARRDLNELGKARRLAKGGVDDILEAVEIAAGISDKSPLYGEAQDLIREFGRSLLAEAERALDRQDGTLARRILDNMPAQTGLDAEVADYRTLLQAHQLAWQASVDGLEGAIVRLQSISRDRPLYGQAQQLIAGWQRQIQGLSTLEWARRISEPGTLGDLQAAINEVEQIPRGNPVWDEAQAQADRWRAQIQRAEDQPLLDQADILARQGDLAGAIANARLVSAGRVLYPNAQDRVDRWMGQLQRSEDRPILIQAQQLADTGQLQQAIQVASQIGTDRVLYDEAQGEISAWRSQLQGGEYLDRAYGMAQLGTVGALVDAIATARRVSEASFQYAEAEAAINRWSWDILAIAEAEAPFDPERAIAVASQVPRRTEAYAPAQLKIQEWQTSPAMETSF